MLNPCRVEYTQEDFDKQSAIYVVDAFWVGNVSDISNPYSYFVSLTLPDSAHPLYRESD